MFAHKECGFIFFKMRLFVIFTFFIYLQVLPAIVDGAFQHIKYSQIFVKQSSWVAKYGTKTSR